MTKSRTERDQGTTPTRFPETTPGSSGGFDSTIYAMLAEMRGSLGGIKSSIESLKDSVDSTKSKVEDLVNWKHKIIGGAIAIGAIATFLGFLIGLAWNYIYIKSPTTQSQPIIQQPIVAPTISPTNRSK